jgi:hypothetical protein
MLNTAFEFSGEGVSHLYVGAFVGMIHVGNVLLEWYETVPRKLELVIFSSSSLLSLIPTPPEHPWINRRQLDAKLAVCHTVAWMS